MNVREPLADNVATGGPADLLAAIPHILGFHPSSSLVVVCVHGTRQRSGLVMRIDLPDPPAYRLCASEIVVRSRLEQPDGVVLVCYDDGPDGDGASAGRRLPRRELIDALVGEFAAGPVAVVDALLVRRDRWWSYLCEKPTCCPPDGTPLPSPTRGVAGMMAAETAFRGRRTLASRQDLEACVRGPSGAHLEAAQDGFDRMAALLVAQVRTEGLDAVHESTLATVEAVLGRYLRGDRDIADDDVARICLGIDDIYARDDVAALPVSDYAAWLALLTELARRTPDPDAAAICTTLGWVAYQCGDGALANVALDRALDADPSYRMAVLLRHGLDCQVSPELIRSVTTSAGERSARQPAAEWASPRSPDT